MTTTKVKVQQPYLKYDSIVVGPGAKDLDGGWYNNWGEFARSSTLRWFGDRNSAVPAWATSSLSDRTDWAFEVHQAGIEFVAPTVNENLNALISDNWMPEIFTTTLPNQMAFDWRVAETDFVLKVPGVHAPAGVGPTGAQYDSSPSGVIYPATNGATVISNSWKFPTPMKIATRTQMTVESRIEMPVNALMTAGGLVGPGFKNYPLNAAGFVFPFPNFYFIRVWMRGARFIDNIGARG